MQLITCWNVRLSLGICEALTCHDSCSVNGSKIITSTHREMWVTYFKEEIPLFLVRAHTRTPYVVHLSSKRCACRYGWQPIQTGCKAAPSLLLSPHVSRERRGWRHVCSSRVCFIFYSSSPQRDQGVMCLLVHVKCQEISQNAWFCPHTQMLPRIGLHLELLAPVCLYCFLLFSPFFHGPSVFWIRAVSHPSVDGEVESVGRRVWQKYPDFLHFVTSQPKMCFIRVLFVTTTQSLIVECKENDLCVGVRACVFLILQQKNEKASISIPG